VGCSNGHAAEDDADGWIVVRSHHLLLEIIEVEIHLSGVPMTKRSDLEIQQYVAAKETMVKDQVDIVVLRRLEKQIQELVQIYAEDARGWSWRRPWPDHGAGVVRVSDV
jgi:hypothetical protein